jgi:hypothetical protein
MEKMAKTGANVVNASSVRPASAKKMVVKERTDKAGIRIKKADTSDPTSLVWYKITEQTRFVLNNALASHAVMLMAERDKPHPDQKRIDELILVINKIRSIIRNPDSFGSIEEMQRLTEQFSTANDAG